METAVRDLDDSTDLVGAIESISQILSAVVSLGALETQGVSDEESRLCTKILPLPDSLLTQIRANIIAGADPLGEAYSRLILGDTRKRLGAVYTPIEIVRNIAATYEFSLPPSRVIDVGCGSGRFLTTLSRQFPNAKLMGYELDPVASLISRANLETLNLSSKYEIHNVDFLTAPIDHFSGPTLYIGNPPYVRHHLLLREQKDWLVDTAMSLGKKASRHSGLHAYFFLRIAEVAQKGDYGLLLTSSEWLATNYGSLIRELLLERLGLMSLSIINPTTGLFPGTSTTANVVKFEAGRTSVEVTYSKSDTISTPSSQNSPIRIEHSKLAKSTKWTHLERPLRANNTDLVELGEICRVHRGQATGANNVWITSSNPFCLPDHLMLPAITRAKELRLANGVISDPTGYKRVIDLPLDLDMIPEEYQENIHRFLQWATEQGAHLSYLARHRRRWWSVELRNPAPILATYMSKQHPAFVRNAARLRHVNIAHGFYPTIHLSDRQLDLLVAFLASNVHPENGRTYAHGLVKFEPKEMERLLVPRPDLLETIIDFD